MEQFCDFAYIYDKLNVNYDKKNITSRLLSLLSGRRDILDLACGTGDVAIALSKAGHRVTGVDISEDMLNVAVQKAASEAARVMFLCEDAKKLELMYKVDAVCSVCDGMNYMLGKEELEKVFVSVRNILKTEGLFIFDISTVYKYENILKNNAFTFDYDDLFLSWQNEYDEKKHICTMSITGFEKKGKNTYTRFDEEHRQYAHRIEDVRTSLEATGFEVIGIYSGYSDEAFRENDERVLFVTKKTERNDK